MNRLSFQFWRKLPMGPLSTWEISCGGGLRLESLCRLAVCYRPSLGKLGEFTTVSRSQVDHGGVGWYSLPSNSNIKFVPVMFQLSKHHHLSRSDLSLWPWAWQKEPPTLPPLPHVTTGHISLPLPMTWSPPICLNASTENRVRTFPLIFVNRLDPSTTFNSN